MAIQKRLNELEAGGGGRKPIQGPTQNTSNSVLKVNKPITVDKTSNTTKINNTSTVSADRQISESKVPVVDTYKETPVEDVTQTVTPDTVVPPVETSTAKDIDTLKQEMINLIMQQQEAQTAAARDAANASYTTVTGNINKAYNQATAQQEALRGDVSEQFESNISDVDARRYQEQEYNRVSGEQRGIGSSAQFQALNRGTISRASRLKLEAAQQRDKALNDISQRIANLRLQRDIDISNAGAARDMAIAQGTASAASQAFGQQFQLGQEDINRRYQTSERESSQAFAAGEAEKSREFQSSENALGREFQAYLQQQGFNHDITMFDKSSSLQKYMQTQSQAFELSMYDKKRADAKADEAYNYALNLTRDLNKYTPGTPEYEAMKGAIDLQTQTMRDNMELDWEYQKKAMNFQTVLEKNAYEESLNRQLNQYAPGSVEYAIAERSKEAQMKEWKDKLQFEVQANYLADAIDAQVQAGIGENYPSWMAQFKSNLTKTLIEKLTPGEKFDAFSVEQARKAGLVMPTKEWYDNKAYYDNLYDLGIITAQTRDTLTK